MKASLKAALLGAVLLICALVAVRVSVANSEGRSQPGTASTASSTASPSVTDSTTSSKAGVAQINPGTAGKGDIEVTSRDGVTHIVHNCVEDRHLQGSGTPWDDAVAMDRDIPRLKTLIAVNLHPTATQSEGYTSQDLPLKSAVLLLPMSAIADIKFGTTGAGQAKRVESSVRLADGDGFTAGGGFGHLAGKESLGSLGSADFDCWVGDITELKAFSPKPFTADFSFFDTHETPFQANITDTAGTLIVLTKALFLDIGQTSKSRYPYIGDTEYDSVVFSSSLSTTRSKATSLNVPSSKISKIKLGKPGNDGYAAQVTLRTGEVFDLTIISAKGMIMPSSGILGCSTKGWVWVPWSVVLTVDVRG